MTSQQINRTKVLVYEHRLRFAKYMARFIVALVERSAAHDDTKIDAAELEPYANVIDEFSKYPFGSDEYNQLKASLQGALVHHYANNRHHPEFFEIGVNGMNLVDLLETLADWKSATQNTGGNGDLLKSIGILSEKYGISPQLTQILINTAKDFGLL